MLPPATPEAAPTAEPPAIRRGTLSDLLGHLAFVLHAEAPALGLSPNTAQQLIGASEALRTCPGPRVGLDALRRLLRAVDLRPALALRLAAEHASPFKGEAWDADWSRAIAQLEALAADTAPAPGASPVKRAP